MRRSISDIETNIRVSMKSGLEGRNNMQVDTHIPEEPTVSMKSGLEGRNNCGSSLILAITCLSQ